MAWNGTSLCLVVRILIGLILTSFASVLVAFIDERIFEGPYSTIIDVSLVSSLDFQLILLYISSTSVSKPCPSLMLESLPRKHK